MVPVVCVCVLQAGCVNVCLFCVYGAIWSPAQFFCQKLPQRKTFSDACLRVILDTPIFCQATALIK